MKKRTETFKVKLNGRIVEITVKAKLAPAIKARLKERHRIVVLSQR
jgi:hypothetical protein